MSPNFLVDSMHGYVAKWLRIMGYDTVYLKNTQDDEAIRLALNGRILITSDVELARAAEVKGAQVVLVKGLSEEGIIRLLSERFKLSPSGCLRCTVCNGELEEIGFEDVRRAMGSPPKGISKFWRCKDCGKIYWKGSHWRNISRQISIFTGKEPEQLNV
ncbi:MAG: Mut7-C RNAse domain-containing protein [Thermoproteota archaeon]